MEWETIKEILKIPFRQIYLRYYSLAYIGYIMSNGKANTYSFICCVIMPISFQSGHVVWADRFEILLPTAG